VTELIAVLRGALAGRYDVQRELGRGGMATVFLADDLKHGRPVAIKVLHPEIAAGLGSDRFLREIQIAARLQHPHILPLYDSGTAGTFLYYVMPFVEGESLRDRLHREKQLSFEETLRISTEVANALAYAHSRGVVHRDIKPENILLSAGTAVVADFGIARAAASAAEAEQLTQTGTIVGTPAYMSPEQATGSEVDGRSDEYSLACVTYEMLVGSPPFTGPNARAVMARHSIAEVSPPSIVRSTLPDTAEDAILRALAKAPADRFPTTALFAEALARSSQVSGHSRWTTSVRAQPIPSRSPIPRSVYAALGGALVLAAGWFGVQAFRRSGTTGAASGGGGLDPRRIAVLYFDDLSQGGELGPLAAGLTESLIRELARVQGLQVTSRNGVVQFRGARATPDSIGRALRVGTLVEGSVARSGDRLRVTVALVNATSGALFGDTTIDRPRGELFQLQDDVSQDVAFMLRRQLGEEVQLAEARAGTQSVKAWELVQDARQRSDAAERRLAAGDTTMAARLLAESDSLLAQAAALDQHWVAPLVQRGWLAKQRLELVGTFDKAVYATGTARGIALADQALKLAPGDADALALRGTMRYWRFVLNLSSDTTEVGQLLSRAEADLRAAVAADPKHAAAWAMLSHLLMRKSETAEGKLAALRAYEADPYASDAEHILWRLFGASLYLQEAFPQRAEFRRLPARAVCAPGAETRHRARVAPARRAGFALPAQPARLPAPARHAVRRDGTFARGPRGQRAAGGDARARRCHGRSVPRSGLPGGHLPQPGRGPRRIAAPRGRLPRNQSAGSHDDAERRHLVVAGRARGPAIQGADRSLTSLEPGMGLAVASTPQLGIVPGH
jgi:serine/threonine-protein kinase